MSLTDNQATNQPYRHYSDQLCRSARRDGATNNKYTISCCTAVYFHLLQKVCFCLMEICKLLQMNMISNGENEQS